MKDSWLKQPHTNESAESTSMAVDPHTVTELTLADVNTDLVHQLLAGLWTFHVSPLERWRLLGLCKSDRTQGSPQRGRLCGMIMGSSHDVRGQQQNITRTDYCTSDGEEEEGGIWCNMALTPMLVMLTWPTFSSIALALILEWSCELFWPFNVCYLYSWHGTFQ